MKRMMRLTTAALFGATMLATPALAQTTGEDPAMQPSQTEDTLKLGADVDTETTAAIDTDFDSAIDLMGTGDAAATIGTMTDVGEVRIISMSTLDNSDEARIDQAMGESEAEIQELQAAISANPTVVAQLEEQGAAPQDVLAADVAANGSLVVYTR
jgi:hypothetical protein